MLMGLLRLKAHQQELPGQPMGPIGTTAGGGAPAREPGGATGLGPAGPQRVLVEALATGLVMGPGLGQEAGMDMGPVSEVELRVAAAAVIAISLPLIQGIETGMAKIIGALY